MKKKKKYAEECRKYIEKQDKLDRSNFPKNN